MLYCNPGEKPTIKYRFGNGNEKIYKSDFAPIEVESKQIPVEASVNYNPEGYQITVSAVNGGGTFTIVDHKEIWLDPMPEYGFSVRTKFLAIISCGFTTFTRDTPCTHPVDIALGCLRNAFNLGGYTINGSAKCPVPNTVRCAIIVKYENLVIFQDQGDCPLSYSVQCGRCEPDEIECLKSTYPGFCCIPCSEIHNGILQIKNQVKQINR